MDFTGLDPINAKLLTELETQLGAMNKYAFELKTEMELMRRRIDSLERILDKMIQRK